MAKKNILAFLIAACLSLALDAAENLCPAPGFEEKDAKGWEGTPDHVTWDDAAAHTGKRSAKVFSDGGKTVGWTSDLIPLPKPGCRFTLEGWVKVEGLSGENRGALMVLYTVGKDKERNGQTAPIAILPPRGEPLTAPWQRYATLGDVFKPDVHYVRVNLRLYGAKGTAWFDDIAVRLFEGADITAPRAIRHETNLVRDGKPLAAIVAGSDGKACAEALQQTIRETTGVDLPLVDAAAIDLVNEKRDLIIIGSLETNPCIEYLYRRSYTYEDRYFPGGGGYVLRPLVNPLGTGANILVLGASDEVGINAGTEALRQIIRSTGKPGDLCPRIPLTVRAGKDYKGTRYFPWSGSPPRREMAPAAEYLKSGDIQCAKAYCDLILKTWFIPDETLFASDNALHLEYTTKTQSWDLMESSGVFSDEERLRITKRLLDMMRSSQGYEFSGLNPGMHSRENHGIRAAKGFYWGWRHFAKYYRKELGIEVDLWEKKLREFWQAPFASARSFEDSLSQHAFAGSLDNTLTVALCEPEWSKDYFAKDFARKTGERCIAVVNNLGEVVQQGDTSTSDYPADVFAKLAYLYRDGRYLFMLRKRRLGSTSDDPLQGYVVRMESVMPQDHIGVRVIPADKVFYDTVHKGHESVPIEKTFDKLTFRAGFDENDAYLMLDGTARGSHSYDDANTIGEFSENGRIWLCQVDKFNGPTMNFHNAVTVAHDGLGMVTVPGCAELVAACEGKQFGYSATALRQYNGVDWIRHILWLKGRCFFVLDELRAVEPGDYSFVCSWRGLGQPRLAPGLYSASEKLPPGTMTPPRQFFLQFPPDTSAILDRDTEVLGPYLNPHPWHDQALNVLAQARSVQMEKGDSIAFQNMFWSAPNGGKTLDYRRLNENCALIGTAGHPALVGAGEAAFDSDGGGLRVTARFFYVDAQGYAIVAPRLLQVGREQHELPPEQDVVEGTWPNPEGARCVSETLMRLWEAAAATAAHAASKTTAEFQNLTVRWSKELPSSALTFAMRKRAGSNTIAVGTEDGTVLEFGMDGTSVGIFKTEKPVHALASCDLNGDGTEEMLVGSDDEQVYALDAAMKPLWTHKVDFLREEQHWMWWTLGSSKVRKILCDDITGDGVPEVIVGAGNMRLNVLDNKGQHLWRFRTDHGIPTTIVTADFFGAGKRNILCGNGFLSSNGSCWVLSGTGKKLKEFYNDSWCTTLPAIAFGDPNGDGKPTLFCGNNRGNLRAYDPQGNQREPRWIFNLAGPIRKIVLLPKAGDRPGLVVTASDSGCLTAFREDGSKAWVATLGPALTEACLARDGIIIPGGKDGRVFLVDPAGRVRAIHTMGEHLRDVSVSEDGSIIVLTQRHLSVMSMP
ncbi:MAG: hypothetical protein AB1696_11580 [Planctomycetota bacterium]